MAKAATEVKELKNKFPNTLDHIQKEIVKDLANGRPILVFKNKAELNNYLTIHFMQMVRHGQVSYDPTEGEVIISFAPMDVFAHLQDSEPGVRIADEIKAFFKEEGWDDAAVIPHRTGVSKTLISLRSKSLKAQKLAGSDRPVAQAINQYIQKEYNNRT